MAQTTKPKAKKPSRTARLAKIRARADQIGRAIRIKKSRIAAGGGGAFTTVAIKRGESRGGVQFDDVASMAWRYRARRCVGFYLGAAGKRSENRDYIVEGDGGPSRDAYDAAGRLVVDGRKVNCHGWTADDWTKLKKEATWAGVESSWTRLTVWNSTAFVGDDARFHTGGSSTTPRRRTRTSRSARTRAGASAGRTRSTRRPTFLPIPSSTSPTARGTGPREESCPRTPL